MRRLWPAAVLMAVGAAVLLFFPLGSLGGSRAENTWSGTWERPGVGRFEITQSGTGISGKWFWFGNGTLQGTIQPNGRVTGTWAVTPGNPGNLIYTSGTITWNALSADGKSFTGSSSYGPENRSWDGRCVGGPCLQNRAAVAATPKCRPPLRLPASVQGEKTCRYLVHFTFDVLQVIPNGRNERTRGAGAFFVELSAKDSQACTHYALGLRVRHEHEPLQGKDVEIIFEEDPSGDRGQSYFCLSLKGRGTKTLTATVKLRVYVKETNDDVCPIPEMGRNEGDIEIRAGKPFSYVHLEVCNHYEKYWPVGQDHPAKIKGKISIRPAG